MIALRGELRRDNNNKSWKWSGVWAFGSLPKTASLVSHSRKARNPAARPFIYTWDVPRSAESVLIPSANLPNDKSDDDKTEAETAEIDKPVNGEKTETEADKAANGAEAAEIGSTNNADQDPKEKSDKNVSETVIPMEIDPTTSNDSVEAMEPNLQNAQQNIPAKGKESVSEDKEAGSVKQESASDADAKEDAPVKQDTDSKEPETSQEKAETLPAKKTEKDTETLPAQGKAEEEEKSGDVKVTQEMANSNEPDKSASKSDLNIAESKPNETENTKQSGVTYASSSPGDPEYTAASTIHEEKCPLDGRWKGYFENVSQRKDRNCSRVQESFCLFFNATPSKDARVLFLDADEGTDPETTEEAKDADPDSVKKPGTLPPGHIHVRGRGTNQFGTFELLGSYDLESGVLECQRMYVITVDDHSTPTRRRVGSPGSRVARSRSRDESGDGTASTPRAYNTRKRQLNWRRVNLSDDDDDVNVSGRRSSSTKKRPRNSEGRKSPVALAPLLGSTPKSGAKTTVSVPTGSGTKRPSASPRSGGSAGGPPKKRPSPSSRSSSSAAASANAMKLPVAGDPREARWRAAHFLYYQRNDPSAEESGGAASSSSNAAPSFVVYEGEFLQGESLRDGRGVCLYSNGTLYEGEWKRNKEHGTGTLMSSDRKRVIYKGEWERGRMHGHGTYYYSYDSPLYMRRNEEKDGKDGGSRYEGDFKENARHGVGKYVLPNGSMYDGEWQNNVMSGRGTFYWVDGSVYVGQWKDGKRNGQGTLQASNGFTYDGTWVQNTMEGRGIAKYPNGQTYEGLWVGGRREGRGTIRFTNGAVYEGRFRDDCIEGQGTMKMQNPVVVPTRAKVKSDGEETKEENEKDDWMIPIHFQSDMGHIHQKAGFTVGGA